MERKLNRLKYKKYPPIPRTLEKTRKVLSTNGNLFKYGNTLDKRHKFYIDTVIEKMHTFMVFASFEAIDMIKNYIEPEQRRYLIDGTFKVAPNLFYQLLVIVIEYKNDVIILNCIPTRFKAFNEYTHHIRI